MRDEIAHQILGLRKYAFLIPCQVVYGFDTEMYLLLQCMKAKFSAGSDIDEAIIVKPAVAAPL